MQATLWDTISNTMFHSKLRGRRHIISSLSGLELAEYILKRLTEDGYTTES